MENTCIWTKKFDKENFLTNFVLVVEGNKRENRYYGFMGFQLNCSFFAGNDGKQCSHVSGLALTWCKISLLLQQAARHVNKR